MNKRIIGCIQVRMNSNRLPGKALRMIAGKPSIKWVLESVAKSKVISDFIVATTVDRSDDELVSYLRKNNYKVYRGSIDNVAERIFNAGKQLKAEHIDRKSVV